MISKVKALGLAFVAVFAMSGIAASAAQAGSFDWDAGTVVLKGSAEAAPGGTQKFTILDGISPGPVSVECDEVNAEAPVAGAGAPTVTTSLITYNDTSIGGDKCKGPFFTTPAIKMNGCNYKFIPGETVAGNEMETSGTVDIICPEGKQIEIQAPGCETFVGSQNGVGPVIYRTITGTPNDVTIEPKVTNIAYKTQGFLCGTHTAGNGTYTGTVTVKGFNSSGVQTNGQVT